MSTDCATSTTTFVGGLVEASAANAAQPVPDRGVEVRDGRYQVEHSAEKRGLGEAELFKYLLLRPATVSVPPGDELNHGTLESIRAGRPTNNARCFLAWPKLGMCGQSVLVHHVSAPIIVVVNASAPA
jgi:hypothetical protein